ncbi:MAG: MATE family efflux transporter [Actinomycetota bacterium]|nr:MATE family efflux transporter [Actinomycetota bacterium]
MGLLRNDLERRIVRLAIPALGTLAVEPMYVLVDTAIVGRLGTTQLAGLAIASTVLLTVVSLTAALQYGLTPDVAFQHGRGDAAEARRVATNGLQLAALIGIPMGTLLAIGARPLCWLIGGRGDVLENATTYLRISAVGLPFVLIAYVGHGVMRGVNQLRKPLVLVFVANLVNLVLEIVAVYVLDLGIAGSAWSTVIAQVGAAIAFAMIMRPHLTSLRPTLARMRPVLASGRHFAVRSLAMYAVCNTATFVAARIDTPTLAAHQVLTQLFIFLALVLDALAIPAQSLVAGALGGGQVDEATRVGHISARLSLWGAGLLATGLVLLSPIAPQVFTNDAAVQSRLAAGLLILAVMQFPGALAFAYDGALIGAKDERWLGHRAVLNLTGYAPLAIATLFVPALGLAGLWGAQMSWMVLRAVVNTRRWRLLSGNDFRRVAA